MNTSRLQNPSDEEPLSPEELEAVALYLEREKWLNADERRALVESLETTAIIRSQRAWQEVTQASIALFLVREHGLHLGRLNELGMPMETWNQYLDYMGRRGMARSTAFKHLSSLSIFHRGLGRNLLGALRVPGGVQSIHHIKTIVDYDARTGEILGPKNPTVLESLPYPDEDLVVRLNKVFDDIETGGPVELSLSPRSVAKLLCQDYGNEPQINFYWTLGPWGQALAWYYRPDEQKDYRGIVGIDEMPQTVAYKLGQMAQITEKDPTPFEEQLLKEDKVFHQVILAGYLGNDPEMRFTPSGHQVTNFSLATSRKWTNADGVQVDETVWWRITAWGKLAEITNEYLKKGNPALILGRMNPNEYGSPRIWTTRDGEPAASYEVTADQVRFLGRGTDREEPKEEEQSFLDDEDMELPF